ncbi:hypothetical protein QQF64_019639 [Cirrhinus molitorella]|uniref:Uncharacterized protein n=1 Tax=Cirrhinus molitorella TaxID=172907 RepID=A0ABR3LG76_9TELE
MRHKDPSFDQFICSLSEERGKDSPSEMSLSQKQSVRSGSHVSSSVSVKSDCSKGRIPNFSEEQSRTKRIKEAALDFTLYFLREMEQDEAADTLEDELFFIHQLKCSLKKKPKLSSTKTSPLEATPLPRRTSQRGQGMPPDHPGAPSC